MEEIFLGEIRSRFLAEAEACRWGPEMFQPFSRTVRLDAIARAIQLGELTESDIDSIRLASLDQPTLLLN